MAQSSSHPNPALQPKLPSTACTIVSRPIAELKPQPRNPRVHTPKQIRQIARSIEVFGFNVPVLVDRELNVIAGHGRLLACRELGIDEVPTIQLDHLTDTQAQAFLVADNRLTEIATWDEKLLGEELKALAAVELDFSLEATGFEMGEIDVLIEGLTPAPEGERDPADELPEPHPTAVSQDGDLWLLGPHRVLCGNALDGGDYDRVMDGRKTTMVITDPPYNVQIDGHVSGLGKTRHREFVMASGELSEAEFTDFLAQAFRRLVEHSADGSLHYIFMDFRHLHEMMTAGRASYTELKNLCVWVKDNGGMGSLYRSQHELVFVFKNGGAAHRNNVELGRFGRYRTNVWQYPGVNSFGRNTEEGNLPALHPTVKPVALVADAIFDASARGEVVLDPFLGSGTTVIAAERTGRVCHGLELDPLYVDTVVRRWQRFTGLKAHHAVSGRYFDEVAAETAVTEVQHG